MNDSNKQKLERKKQEIRRKIQTNEWVKSFVDDTLDVFREFDSKKLNYEITGLKLFDKELEDEIRNQLSQPEYSLWNFHQKEFNPPEILQKIETLFDKFPTTNPLRYVPDLPEFFPEDSEKALNEIVSRLNLKNEKVNLNYLRYAPLIKIPLDDLRKAQQNEIINLWHGDLLIFPSDLSWLIVHTLEENWFYSNG